MNAIFYSVIGFVIAIAILVVVHEFGHFWVARRLGVKVLRFSVGFGKPLWMRRAADGTEYALSAIPLGGYVKMLDENEGAVPEADKARAFNRQSIPRRMAIVLAGPLFNLLFAVLAYWVLFMVGVEGLKPIVGKVTEHSIAAQAGFQSGDTLVRIDGVPVHTWEERRLYLFARALDRAHVRVEVRDPKGQLRTLTLDFSGLSPDKVNDGALERAIGLYPDVPELQPVVGFVAKDGPAARGGLLVGDRVVRIDGKPVTTWDDAVKAIEASPDHHLNVTVERRGKTTTLVLVPRAMSQDGKTVGKIDAGVDVPPLPPELRATLRLNPIAAFGEAAGDTWAMSALTLKVLYKMLTLQMSTKNISGPITIAQYAGYSVQIGLGRFLMFLAVVSISLGVLNLLPVPVLDGGHLLYYVVEAVIGRPLSQQTLEFGQRVGIVLLLGLMMLAFYNDFARILY